jgi:hypothetical protein
VLKLVGDEVATGAEEFLAMVAERSDGAAPVFASPNPEVILSALEASSLIGEAKVERVSAVLAPAIGRLGYRKALRGETVDALHLDANYVRRSDADGKWKEF